MTRRKASYTALRRRMLRVANLLEYWAAVDRQLPPVAEAKIDFARTAWRRAAREIRENL